MTALEFIKKFGWNYVTKLSKVKPHYFEDGEGNQFHTSEFQQYVDAYELVQSCGGVDDARKIAHKDPFDYHNQYELLKAIALVEQVNATN